jgi:para-nitrobenzyl esterase
MAQSTISRRSLIASTAALGAMSLLPTRAFAIATGVTRDVKTSNGPVRGLVDDGIQTFLGMRYGAPPVGPLRFMPPKKPDPWTATATCMFLGAPSMQILGGGGASNYPDDVGPALGQLMNPPEDIIRQHEDCLFINLWTPELGGAKKRPVMVWFHGGGFAYGSGNWPVYDGHNLARNHDVVVITVNHRLNVFGFLDLAELGGDPSSGNAGMLDLVAVLEWVRDNIAEFGGDPGNVTVFGQSGGGGKVSTILAMPAAKGLLHRAIIESGPGLRAIPQENGTKAAKALMAKLGVSDVKSLQALPAAAVLAAASTMNQGGPGSGFGFAPVVDGVSLPTHPFDPVAPAVSANVPVLIGFTKDEMTLYNVGLPWWGKLTMDELVAKLEPQFKDKTRPLIEAYHKRYPDYSPSYLYTAVAGTQFAAIGSITLAERKAAQKAAPVFMYVWEWGAPVDGGILKAPHTMEIPFVFDNVEKGPMLLGTAPSTRALAKQASAVWTGFARSGDPNAPGTGLPHWPAYDAETRATMMFNLESRIENDPLGDVRRIMLST